MNPFTSNKLLRFPDRIAEWMRTGITTGPIVVDFDITNKCPHNCPLCPGEWRSDPSAQLSVDEAKDYLRQLADMGTQAISFGGGGDPLAHPEALDIIEYAADLGFSVGVITNGAIVRDPNRLAASCKWVRVSLDAASATRFAKVHGVPESYFNKVVQNIRRLAEVKGDCVIGVGFLTDSDSRSEICDAADLVSRLGADYIQYRPFNHDDTDVTAEIETADRMHGTDTFSVLASWPKYELIGNHWEKPYSRCHIHHFTVVITAKAEMMFCCDMRCNEGCIGNLRETRIIDLWNSKRKRQIADGLDVKKCPALCRGNVHNLILDKIANPVCHEEFL